MGLADVQITWFGQCRCVCVYLYLSIYLSIIIYLSLSIICTVYVQYSMCIYSTPVERLGVRWNHRMFNDIFRCERLDVFIWVVCLSQKAG